jgi:hypothetical protein
MVTTFDGQGLGGFDLGLNLENLNAELLAYGQTAEGQQFFRDQGIDPASFGGAEPDYAQIVNDAYAPKYGYYTPDVGGTAGVGESGGGGNEEDNALAVAMQQQFEFEQSQLEAATKRRKEDARVTMANVLNTYGLGELSDYIYNEIIVKETVNLNNPDAIIFAIREQPAYKKRFAANATRLKNGLTELLPGEYIGLEDQFKTMIRSNGLPAGFYDSEDDLRKLIEGDVSPSEFQRRIEDGYNAVVNADPEVKRQFKEFYNVSDGGLAAYFLDPKRGEPLLANQARAAQIAARGLEQGGIQLTGAFAENLATRGITEQQARAGFAEVGGLGELKQTFAGETALSSEQLAGAAFGLDVAAQQELERKRRLRTGEFAGGGSFARTTGETSGSISTSVGKAQ